jgi:hypothetical protein
VITRWRQRHPGQDGDGTFTQPWPATSAEKPAAFGSGHLLPYRYDRAGAPLRGIDEQLAKANGPSMGSPVKRNRFIKADRGDQSVNRDLEAKARGLAGLKGYTTNLTGQVEFVLTPYTSWARRAPHVKYDAGRPVYAGVSRSGHLTIVFAALAVSHWIEHQTGWSIKIHRTARALPHRQSGRQTSPDRRRPPTRRPPRHSRQIHADRTKMS